MILYSVFAGEEGERGRGVYMHFAIELMLLTKVHLYEGQVMSNGIGSLHGIIITYASSEKIYTYTMQHAP